MFRGADGVFDLGDYRVFVRRVEERDKEREYDVLYDVLVEERGRRLVGLRCGTLSDSTLSVPGSTIRILKCRDEERGSQLFVEEHFTSGLGKPLYRGPLFTMQVAEGCFAGIGTTRDCQSPSTPLIVEACHCPDDLRRFHLGSLEKLVVPGRLEAALVIEGDKAKVFVPEAQPARDFVVSSMVLLLSFARLDRGLPRGTFIGIPGCE